MLQMWSQTTSGKQCKPSRQTLRRAIACSPPQPCSKSANLVQPAFSARETQPLASRAPNAKSHAAYSQRRSSSPGRSTTKGEQPGGVELDGGGNNLAAGGRVTAVSGVSPPGPIALASAPRSSNSARTPGLTPRRTAASAGGSEVDGSGRTAARGSASRAARAATWSSRVSARQRDGSGAGGRNVSRERRATGVEGVVPMHMAPHAAGPGAREQGRMR
mmetsp:Transcript_50466/g.145488  ORF Transcript_50466/g.145488 Transcript_50466/m.145488 type:complete len:218 (+) Transcript_50466:139-792(+)